MSYGECETCWRVVALVEVSHVSAANGVAYGKCQRCRDLNETPAKFGSVLQTRPLRLVRS